MSKLTFILILYVLALPLIPYAAADDWVENQKAAFKEVDKDFDGKSDGKWTLQDYMKQMDFALGPENMSSEDKQKAKDHATKMFKIIDANGDDIVTEEEFSSPTLKDKFE